MQLIRSNTQKIPLDSSYPVQLQCQFKVQVFKFSNSHEMGIFLFLSIIDFGTFSGYYLKFKSFFQIVKFDPSVALTLEKNIQHIIFTFSIYLLLEFINVKS